MNEEKLFSFLLGIAGGLIIVGVILLLIWLVILWIERRR